MTNQDDRPKAGADVEGETCSHEGDSDIGEDTRWCANCGAISVVIKTVPVTVWSEWGIPDRIIALSREVTALRTALREAQAERDAHIEGRLKQGRRDTEVIVRLQREWRELEAEMQHSIGRNAQLLIELAEARAALAAAAPDTV